MPSPFPGMDPYLEGPLWTSVHTQLAVEIQRQLVPLLRPRYLALTNERFIVMTADPVGGERTDDIYPDVLVTEGDRAGFVSGGGAVIAAPLRVATVMPEAVPQVSVEVRDVAERRLVADIEILSPTNKRGEGRLEYLTRRQRLLLSQAHLMEIDLLRSGERVPMRKALPRHPYFVYLSRAERRPITDVWPIRLNQPLPVVPVPLLPGDPDVRLDLQQALTNVYDLAGYDLAVNYSGPPTVSLDPKSATWANAVLRKRGKRKKGSS